VTHQVGQTTFFFSGNVSACLPPCDHILVETAHRSQAAPAAPCQVQELSRPTILAIHIIVVQGDSCLVGINKGSQLQYTTFMQIEPCEKSDVNKVSNSTYANILL